MGGGYNFMAGDTLGKTGKYYWDHRYYWENTTMGSQIEKLCFLRAEFHKSLWDMNKNLFEKSRMLFQAEGEEPVAVYQSSDFCVVVLYIVIALIRLCFKILIILGYVLLFLSAMRGLFLSAMRRLFCCLRTVNCSSSECVSDWDGVWPVCW